MLRVGKDLDWWSYRKGIGEGNGRDKAERMWMSQSREFMENEVSVCDSLAIYLQLSSLSSQTLF